jgi:hypothetical protein
MGYFRRKIRRGRCRAAMHGIAHAPADDPPLPEAPRAEVAQGQVFLRLAAHELHPASTYPAGIFAAAGWLRDSARCTIEDRARLRRWLRWFNRNLTVPRDIPPAAIFWFRADGRCCLHRLWGIVRTLRRYGSPVRFVTTVRPGRVVYSDNVQIAAIPDGRNCEI